MINEHAVLTGKIMGKSELTDIILTNCYFKSPSWGSWRRISSITCLQLTL